MQENNFFILHWIGDNVKDNVVRQSGWSAGKAGDVDQIQNPKEKGCLNAMKQLTKWMESRQDIAKSPPNPKSQEKGCKGYLDEGTRDTVKVNE